MLRYPAVHVGQKKIPTEYGLARRIAVRTMRRRIIDGSMEGWTRSEGWGLGGREAEREGEAGEMKIREGGEGRHLPRRGSRPPAK